MRRDDLARGALLLTCALYLRMHHGHSSGVLLCYVGPGPGFAFLGSLLSLLVGFLLNLFSLLSWPVRIVWRLVRRRGGFRKAHVKKVIFLGLDGLDPRLAERFMAEGKLPNLARLKEHGSYSRLRTTFPALSPVAWSTFATGVNPAKHHLQGDDSVQAKLPRPIDDAHSAAAEFIEDFVARNVDCAGD